MNIRQMAALNVAKIIGFAVSVAVIFNLGIHYLGIATVGTIAALAMLAYVVKFAYDIELNRLEAKNALKKIKEAE